PNARSTRPIPSPRVSRGSGGSPGIAASPARIPGMPALCIPIAGRATHDARSTLPANCDLFRSMANPETVLIDADPHWNEANGPLPGSADEARALARIDAARDRDEAWKTESPASRLRAYKRWLGKHEYLVREGV